MPDQQPPANSLLRRLMTEPSNGGSHPTAAIPPGAPVMAGPATAPAESVAARTRRSIAQAEQVRDFIGDLERRLFGTTPGPFQLAVPEEPASLTELQHYADELQVTNLGRLESLLGKI